jgi:hypothetical protein
MVALGHRGRHNGRRGRLVSSRRGGLPRALGESLYDRPDHRHPVRHAGVPGAGLAVHPPVRSGLRHLGDRDPSRGPHPRRRRGSRDRRHTGERIARRTGTGAVPHRGVAARQCARRAARIRSGCPPIAGRGPVRSAPPPTPEAWIWRLQSLTTDLAPNARFTFENDHRIEPLPVEPALAVLEATAEALRNSVAHAGTATRAVHARATPFGLEVTVLDDGSGFDPDAVRPERLGVRVSILDRMRSLPGGHAHIVSRPGVGTRIVISWLAS